MSEWLALDYLAATLDDEWMARTDEAFASGRCMDKE